MMSASGEVDKERAKAAQHRISEWKNDLIKPSEAISHAKDEQDALFAHLYEKLQRYLKACNCVDFDDLIALPTGCWSLTNLFESNGKTRYAIC